MNEQPWISAKWLLLAMAAIALGLAILAWLYWYSIGNETQRRFGTEIAFVIARAPHAEALLLDDTKDKAGDAVRWRAMQRRVVARRDLSRGPSPGWSHVRTLLLRDAAYDKGQTEGNCSPDWRYGLRFWDSRRQVILLISTDCSWVAFASGWNEETADSARRKLLLPKEDVPISIAPIQSGLGEFLAEQFEGQ
jgi:hypothetical protein